MASTRFRIVNVTRGTTLAESSEKATNWVKRGVGLTWRRSLPADGGLIIDPSNAVVSFFMRFTIDVIFMDANNQVVYVLHRMVPWRASRIVRGAKYVIELPAGRAEETGTGVGDAVEITPVPSGAMR